MIALTQACQPRGAPDRAGRAAADPLVEGRWVLTQRGFAIRGYVGMTPDSTSVIFAASVRNPGPDTVEVVLEGCATGARAFGSAERSGRALWRAPEPGCSMIGPIGRRLAPGDTLPMAQFTSRYPVNGILGDSLPDGQYHIDVSPPVAARDTQVSAERITLYLRDFVPAGVVRLKRRDRISPEDTEAQR
jgi:hypothetical protein